MYRALELSHKLQMVHSCVLETLLKECIKVKYVGGKSI